MKIGGPEGGGKVERVTEPAKIADKRETVERREGDAPGEQEDAAEQTAEGKTIDTAMAQGSWQSVLRVLAEDGSYVNQVAALISAEQELRKGGLTSDREAVSARVNSIDLPEGLKAHLANLIYKKPGNARFIRA